MQNIDYLFEGMLYHGHLILIELINVPIRHSYAVSVAKNIQHKQDLYATHDQTAHLLFKDTTAYDHHTRAFATNAPLSAPTIDSAHDSAAIAVTQSTRAEERCAGNERRARRTPYH